MNPDAIAVELTAALSEIDGLRTYKGPPDSVSVPAGVVVLPTNVAFDQTYGRGSDKLIWPVLVLVGRPSDRTVMERISGYLDGSGSTSVKVALEGYAYTTCDDVYVRGADVDIVTWQGTEFVGALFHLEIFGQGA